MHASAPPHRHLALSLPFATRALLELFWAFLPVLPLAAWPSPGLVRACSYSALWPVVLSDIPVHNLLGCAAEGGSGHAAPE